MHDTTLIDIGSCGIRIVHRAFRDGALESGWGIGKLLSSLYTLFNNTPARRDDFIRVTDSDIFQLKFCSHRWVENVSVAEPAIKIWENIKTYINKVLEKELPNPGTVSFDIVRESCADVLVIARLYSFISVANMVEPFLIAYQTDKPMLPFLGDNMFRLIKGLMQRFMRSDVLTSVTKSSLMLLDPSDKK